LTVTERYQKKLRKNEEALEFLYNRGFSDKTIERFEIGYERWDAPSHLRGRIILPLHSEYGDIMGYYGRVLYDGKYELDEDGEPVLDEGGNKVKVKKYWATKGVHKQYFLYGLYQNMREIVEEDMCFITEGQFDVMALSEAGIPAVATNGAQISENQCIKLRRYCNFVVFLCDNDDAGLSGARASEEIAKDYFSTVYIKPLKGGKDANEILMKLGKKELYNMVMD